MTTNVLLAYLSKLNKIFMHSILIVGKMAKSGILNYYGADKYAKQNNINGKNEIIFESLNTLAGFITTYSLSLSSGQKHLNKLLTTPSNQVNNCKNTIKTFPILSILIMFRSLSDVSTDSMIANPILEDAFKHVNKVIAVNIQLTALAFTISFGIIGLFCDIAFNAPAELRLLQKISTIIKKKLGIPTPSLEFTQIEQEWIKQLLKDSIFNISELDQENDDSDQAPCITSPNEKLIQILCRPDIQKTMERLLKHPELLNYCKQELPEEEDALLVLDKLTTLTFNYAACTTFNAHLIRAAVILPTIHLVFIKNMELTATTAAHTGASPKISQNIAYSLGSFIFLLKFISMNGKPVEYLKTALNQPLSILFKDCLNTIKNHPLSLFIGILANAPYLFFSLAQIKDVTPNPYIYYPLSTIFMLAQTITAATFLLPRIIDKFQCCDALCNKPKATVLLQDIVIDSTPSTPSCETESPHAHLIPEHQIEPVNLTIDLPSSIPIAVPKPIKTPNHSLDNVIRMSSPRNHPYHIKQNDSENYSIT